jgi:hypothetical protein
MKTNYVKMFIMLIVVATLSIYQVKAQLTHGAGAINANCSVGITGTNCTFIGCNAGNANTASNNSFFGEHAGFSNTSAIDGAFLGYEAGYSNTTGGYNTFLGAAAGYSNTTGAQNIFIGLEAGYNNTTYSYNLFIGNTAGFNNTSGTDNVFLGYSSGKSNTSGGSNTFLGLSSGFSNTTGSNNVCLGTNAFYYNQTGNYNTVLGSYAGQGNSNSYSDDCFIGYGAGFSNTTGADNTAIGYNALYSNTEGFNTAIGSGALYNNNIEGNTATGYHALYSNTSSAFNVADGNLALENSTGEKNTAVGSNSMTGNTTGYGNTALGYNTNPTNTSDTNCTFIGNGATASGNYLNATAIGNGVTVPARLRVAIGNSNVLWVGTLGFSTWQIGSDGRFKFNIQQNVPGLAFINKLRPVTFQVNTKAVDAYINAGRNKTVIVPHTQTHTFTDSTGTHTTTTTTYDTIVDKNPNANTDFSPSIAVVHSGFIAQQVDSAANAVGFTSSIVHRPENSTDIYSLGYAEFVVPLVKAVQELSKEVDSLMAAAKTTGAVQRTRNNSDGGEPSDATNINNIELANNAVLYQNAPNPFGNGTTIKYFVPANADAQVVFYDEFGSQLKTFKIAENGTGQLNIDSSNLSSGIYSYSLIVNGKVVDTKKMIKQ